MAGIAEFMELQHSDYSSDENEGSDDFFTDLSSCPTKRDTCGRCRRPVTVCLCPHFPSEVFKIQTRVIILQHKDEIKRALATVPLLSECLDREKLSVLRAKGKRINPEHKEHSVLQRALQAPGTVLLYPGRSAVDLCTLPRIPIGNIDDSAILVLDGTWAQAKSMFTQNPYLHHVRQICLSNDAISEYVIRTQPTQGSLSTLESVAHMLAWVEQRPDIVEVLVRPLRALCQHQLQHGAVVHVSKDHPSYVSREEKIKERKKNRSNVT